MNLYAALEIAARKRPEAMALTFKDQNTIYAELLSTVDRFFTSLARMGVPRRDKLALMMRNSPEFVIAYYATVLTGGMPVYPSAKVYLSGGKTKVDVTSDGTTRTFDVP